MSRINQLLTALVVMIVLIGTWRLSLSNEEHLIKEFLSTHEDKLNLESDKITKIFDTIYTNMRAMAFTKEIKSLNITSRATPKDRAQLQNFFEAIAEEVSLSEIYVVPFGTQLSNSSSPHELPSTILALVPNEKSELEEEEKGVETYELLEIETQMNYLRGIAPVVSSFEGVKVPATTGKEVIICDNRGQEQLSDHNTGFVYSLPYYDFNGNFAGVLSAVIKTEVITRLFDDPYYQLKRDINPVLLEKDPKRLPQGNSPFTLSRALPINDRYPWTLEMKIPASVYQENAAIKKIKLQKLILQSLGISTALLILILVFLSSNNLLVKKLNRDLRQEINMRKHSEERLSQFTSDAGHELRSPLAIMKGEVEVAMLRERSTNEYREVLGHVHSSINRLQQLVIDLLNISRMEQGMEKLNLVPTNLSDLINEEFNIVQERLAGDSLIVLDNQVSTDINLLIDQDKMKIAISNILSNALKHSPTKSRITVNCLCDDILYTILIRDEGPGVLADDLQKIFDRFYRTEKARTIGSSGLGLGLSIVQKIIELHGGTVRAYNGATGGLTVEVKLPV